MSPKGYNHCATRHEPDMLEARPSNMKAPTHKPRPRHHTSRVIPALESQIKTSAPRGGHGIARTRE